MAKLWDGMVSNILAALLACLAAVLLARAPHLYLCLFPAASPFPFAATATPTLAARFLCPSALSSKRERHTNGAQRNNVGIQTRPRTWRRFFAIKRSVGVIFFFGCPLSPIWAGLATASAA